MKNLITVVILFLFCSACMSSHSNNSEEKIETRTQQLEFYKSDQTMGSSSSFDIALGDVDGDGDIDICGKPWKGKTCYYLKNMLIN